MTERDHAVEKHVVFFSHSAKDAVPLARLKQRLVEITHDTVDVFLASDGESIKLGTKWSVSTEEALHKTRLMFLFLTPNALRSSWVSFEAGHAHGKGIDVVPVGLFGVDVGNILPPLGALHGFNVTHFGGLNNLIAKVNEVFRAGHPRAFTEEDYRALEQSGPAEARKVLGDHAAAVQDVRLHCRAVEIPEEQLATLYDGLPADATHEEEPNCRSIAGARLTLHAFPDPYDKNKVLHELHAEMDPARSHEVLPVVEPIFERLVPSGRDPEHNYVLSVDFRPRALTWDERSHRVMARLLGTGAELFREGAPSRLPRFRWKNLYFSIAPAGSADAPYPILVIERTTHFADADLGGLVNLLFDTGVFAYRVTP